MGTCTPVLFPALQALYNNYIFLSNNYMGTVHNMHIALHIWVYGIWALTNCTPLPFPAWQTLYNNYILALWSHLLKVKVGKISQLVFVVKRLQNKQFCQIVHRTGHYWLKYFLKLCFTIHVTMLHVTCYTCAHRISTLAKSLGKNIH